MHYTLIGAGALGRLLAAWLTAGKENVTLCDLSEARLDDVRRRGVRHDGFRGAHTVPVTVRTLKELEAQAPLQAVLLCVPPTALEAAVRALLPLADDQTFFVPFAGGLAPFRLPALVGQARTVYSVANLECRLRDDGVVETGFHNFIWSGEPDHAYTDRLRLLQLALSWAAPSFATKVIQGMIWSKALYSVEVALSTLVDAPPTEVFAQRVNRRLAAALVREGIALALAAGVEPIAFDFFDPNLYQAQGRGQGKVMDQWIDHAWQRREMFRNGLEYPFPAQTGLSWSLSPLNPQSEAPALFDDLQAEAARLGRAPLPLTARLAQLHAQVAAGRRKPGWDNLAALEAARQDLNIDVPGPEK